MRYLKLFFEALVKCWVPFSLFWGIFLFSLSFEQPYSGAIATAAYSIPPMAGLFLYKKGSGYWLFETWSELNVAMSITFVLTYLNFPFIYEEPAYIPTYLNGQAICFGLLYIFWPLDVYLRYLDRSKSWKEGMK